MLKNPKNLLLSIKYSLKSSARFSFSRSLVNSTDNEDQQDFISRLHQSYFKLIFIYLSASDLLVCGLVNKLWRKLTHFPTLWQQFIVDEQIPIGPQWNYLIEKYENDMGIAWKMIYFQYHRQQSHWRELKYQQKIIYIPENHKIKCIDGDLERIVMGSEIGIKVLCRNDLESDQTYFSTNTPITAVCLCQDYLATADKSGQITVWNLINSKRETFVKQSYSLGFSALLFFHEMFLVGSALNGNIYIFRFKTTSINIPVLKFGLRYSKIVRKPELKLEKILKGHNSDIFTMIKVGDNLFATGSSDHTIKVWDIMSYQCIKVINGHSLDVLCLACDDDFLWSGSMDKTIKRKNQPQFYNIEWRLKNFDIDKTLIGHTDWVKILSKVPQWLISGGWDEKILFWDNYGQIILKVDLNFGPISACIADHQKLVVNCKGKGHEFKMIVLDFS